MNWNAQMNYFIQKVKTSLPFYQFLCRTLDFDHKSDSHRWGSFSQSLTEWNNKYLDCYEKITLYSPVIWNLNVVINVFRIPECGYSENRHCIENWLYWTFLSSYMNYFVLNNLIVRRKENQIYPWEYFLKAKENTGAKIENFLCGSDLEYLFEKEHIWIDKKTFIQELGQKKEKSYKRLMELSSMNHAMDEEYIKNRLIAYERYEYYEAIFRKMNPGSVELNVTEMNPQGMNDLVDDCMCYFIKTEDRGYVLYFEDYA